MAMRPPTGKYVKLTVNVWWDKSNKRVHITSNDPDLPQGGMHMSCKLGTQSDVNMRKMLDDFGCGPSVTTTAAQIEKAKMISEVVHMIDFGELDGGLSTIKEHIVQRQG